ncbi:hypothetical protein PQG65_08175 [Corynebacterium pseudodiphtheriticum]|uniref:hypothetical protein n=1 Tax=Corynebacterium pseudodiphtheriticum TaxID=37637 RepID=UPI000F881E53|nr:hypothetical protein [Corynebacterium pseudodiphtheriticum]MDC7111344.1 hypothetical protein [Corynebacterium pseudodiphtheriticum]MDC7115174.1 hypothetical protein [Corynebacterium pseudodiphtheriticum]RUP92992.1 hypothetical protein D8M19_07060 [Corynebacterium pseudodiphtheriticum]
MKREVYERFVADVVQKQLDNLVPRSAAETLAPFATEVVAEAMRGKSDEKITGTGTLSIAGVTKMVSQAAHRVYLQGRDITPESVFTMEHFESVAPKCAKDAERSLVESLGPHARGGKDV